MPPTPGSACFPPVKAESVSARRETVFSRGAGGMLSVAGGKLTTYRRIALEVLARLREDLGVHRLDTRPWPLPGAAGLEGVRLSVEVDPDIRAHLLHLYGSLAREVLQPAVDDTSLLERLNPDGPDIAAQARYAITHEWARSPEDVLRRRTTVFQRGLENDATREKVVGLMP